MAELEEIKRVDLFQMWENVPILDIVEEAVLEKITKPVQYSIIDILRTGIYFQHPQTNKQTKRHCLSANEIRKELKKTSDVSISYPNLYFYLNQLEELEIIKPVGMIRTGKRTTTYYCRTAKLFISQDNLGYGQIINEDGFEQFLIMYDENLTTSEITQIRKGINTINRANLENFVKWVSEHQERIDEAELDYQSVMEMYYLVRNVDIEFVSALSKLKELLDIR